MAEIFQINLACVSHLSILEDFVIQGSNAYFYIGGLLSNSSSYSPLTALQA